MLYIMENQNSKKVFSVPFYKGTTFNNNGETNRRNYKTKNDISIIKQKIDSNLHLRIYKQQKCMVFGDIDYCLMTNLKTSWNLLVKNLMKLLMIFVIPHAKNQTTL